MNAVREPEGVLSATKRPVVYTGENATGREPYWPVALIVAAILLASSWFYVHAVPVGDPPDEWAHLGYVADVAVKHHLIPDYRHSAVLNSPAPNYLQHPPLYYTIEGSFGRLFHWDPKKAFARYRMLSSLWVALGLFFWVLACGRLGLDRVRTIGAVAACFAIPMFTYLAGVVNNDDLCYLGVALFFYGFGLFQNRVPAAPYVVALGVVVVFLTKATGALFLTVFLLGWGILERERVGALLRDRNVRIAISVTVILVALYYLPTLFVYHTPFPHPGTLQRDVAAPDPSMNFLRFAEEFAQYMIRVLPVILAHDSSEPIPKGLYGCFYLMLAMPLLAWLVWRLFEKPSWRRNLSDAFLVALAVTVLANLWVAWQGYRHVGQLVGVQPRYYSFVLPGLFVIGFFDGKSWETVRKIFFLVFVLVAVVIAARIPYRSTLDHIYGANAKRFSTIDAQTGAVGTTTLQARVVQANAGYVDSALMQGSSALINGWAIDLSSKAAAREVVISLQGRLIGTIRPSGARPDVADALKSPDAELSGFSAIVQNLPEGINACDLTLQAEQDDGTLAPIAQRACERPK